MRILTLVREEPKDDAIQGELFIEDERFYTLENRLFVFPKGTYDSRS